MVDSLQWSPRETISSIKELIQYIRRDQVQAWTLLQNRDIQQWLNRKRNLELATKIQQYLSHTSSEEQFNRTYTQLIDILQETLAKRNQNNIKFFDLLDINRAIEITLKEYEALRAEVLQNTSEISQLILLGLAAIFTIASIGLAPLSDFLTEEDTTIQMPLNLENVSQIIPNIKDGDFKIYNDDKSIERIIEKELDITKFDQSAQGIIKQQSGIKDLENTKLMIVSTSNDTKYYLKITRATNGKTIEERGIVSSIVIFNWLIPGLSLYLIYRSLFAIKKNRMIGNYIYHRVEQKLVNLSVLGKQYLGIEDDYICFEDKGNPDSFFTTNNQPLNIGNPPNQRKTNSINDNDDIWAANFKEHLINISWQHYIKTEGKNYSDPLDANLIYVLFALISVVSFVGGSALLIFNFNIEHFPLPFSSIEFNWNFPELFLSILKIIIIGAKIIVILLLLYLISLNVFGLFSQQLTNINTFLKDKKLSYGSVSWLIFLIVGLGIMLSFWMTNEELNKLQLIFLVLVPYCLYFICIGRCLKTKDEVEDLIDPDNKRNFRTNSTDRIVAEMWNDTNPNP